MATPSLVQIVELQLAEAGVDAATDLTGALALRLAHELDTNELCPVATTARELRTTMQAVDAGDIDAFGAAMSKILNAK